MGKKVLFLHGYAQSASIYSVKTRSISNTLKKVGYEPVYLQGTHHMPCEVRKNSDEFIDLYAWCPRVKDDSDVVQSLDEFKEQAEQHSNEVEGIVAFSQGACLMGIIIAQYRDFLPNLKWIVFCSGFGLNPKKYGSHYQNLIDVPSLHIIGELDTVINIESSMRLYDVCSEKKRTLWTHQGGHFVPHTNSFINRMVTWIHEVATQCEPKKGTLIKRKTLKLI